MDDESISIGSIETTDTADYLEVASGEFEVLGVGANAEVEFVKGIKGEDWAIKIPYGVDSANQRFEFCFRVALYDALKENGYDHPPVAKPIRITDSKKMYNTEKKEEGITVFTMEKLDEELSDIQDETLYDKYLSFINKACDLAEELGFIMRDVLENDSNIMIKNNKPYINDCGNCKIQEGSKAYEFFQQEAKEQGFEMEQFEFDGYIVDRESEETKIPQLKRSFSDNHSSSESYQASQEQKKQKTSRHL